MRAPWPVLILAVILDPLLLLGEAVCHRNDTNLSVASHGSRETLYRHRRELTFPKGSAFVVSQTTGHSQWATREGKGHLLSRWTFMRMSFLVLRRSRLVKSVRRVGCSFCYDNCVFMRNHLKVNTLLKSHLLVRRKIVKCAFLCFHWRLLYLSKLLITENIYFLLFCNYFHCFVTCNY